MQNGKQQTCTSSAAVSARNNGMMSFIVGLLTACTTTSPRHNGPLLDDGAPYSAIGVVEVGLLFVLTNIDVSRLEPKTKAVSNFGWWQYGQGEHASTRGRILSSVNFTTLSDRRNQFQILHLFVQRSGQWVIGRNVTGKSDNLHYDGSRVLLPPVDYVRDSLSLIDDGLHSFMDLTRFPAFASAIQPVTLTCSKAAPQSSPTAQAWSETRRVLNKVHLLTCGHASY